MPFILLDMYQYTELRSSQVVLVPIESGCTREGNLRRKAERNCFSFTFIRADHNFFCFSTCQGFLATPAELQCVMASWDSQPSSTKLCQNKLRLTLRQSFSGVFLVSPQWENTVQFWWNCHHYGTRANRFSSGYRLRLIVGSSFMVPPRSSFDSLSTEGVLQNWTRWQDRRKFFPLKVGKMDEIHFINISLASARLMVASRRRSWAGVAS